MTALHVATDDEDVLLRGAVAVCNTVGITYRQLDFWCRAGYLPDNAAGSGSQRTFTDNEVDVLHAVSALLDTGMKVDAAFYIAHCLVDTGRYRTVVGSIYELTVTVRDTTPKETSA